jgi:uncharacterized membrane protein (UPF0127 family)
LEPAKNANLVSLAIRAAAAALLALAVAGCGAEKAPEAAPPVKTVWDHFAIAVGGHPAQLQIAVIQAEQERGLMQRQDLGRDEGMLFVDASPTRLSFWMHNTPEPLDLGYLTRDGVVAETYELLPFDERSVTSHGDQLQFALEMPRGWFAANGIRAGSGIDMRAVAGALRARGFDPEKYGLK